MFEDPRIALIQNAYYRGTPQPRWDSFGFKSVIPMSGRELCIGERCSHFPIYWGRVIEHKSKTVWRKKLYLRNRMTDLGVDNQKFCAPAKEWSFQDVLCSCRRSSSNGAWMWSDALSWERMKEIIAWQFFSFTLETASESKVQHKIDGTGTSDAVCCYSSNRRCLIRSFSAVVGKGMAIAPSTDKPIRLIVVWPQITAHTCARTWNRWRCSSGSVGYCFIWYRHSSMKVEMVPRAQRGGAKHCG